MRVSLRSLCRTVAKNVTVEPVLFLFIFGADMYWIILASALYFKICRQNYRFLPGVDCSNLKATPDVETKVQQDSAYWQLYISSAYIVPIIIVGPILGAYGDRYGRKVTMLLGMVGFILSALTYLAEFVFADTMSLYWLPIAGVFIAFTGYIGTVYSSMYAYISDRVLNKTTLTIRFTILQVTSNVAFIVSSYSTGALLRHISVTKAMVIPQVLWTISFFYALIFLRQEPPANTRKQLEQKKLAKKLRKNSEDSSTESQMGSRKSSVDSNISSLASVSLDTMPFATAEKKPGRRKKGFRFWSCLFRGTGKRFTSPPPIPRDSRKDSLDSSTDSNCSVLSDKPFMPTEAKVTSSKPHWWCCFSHRPNKVGKEKLAADQRPSVLGASAPGAEDEPSLIAETWGLMVGAFRACLVKREGNYRAYIWITFFCFLCINTTHIGMHTVLKLYLFHPPLAWTPSDIAYYSGFDHSLMLLGNIISVTVLKKLNCHETTIIIFSTFSMIARLVLIGTSYNSFMIYASAVAGIASNLVYPVSKSLVCQFVGADEIGKIYALFQFATDFGVILSITGFNVLYAETIAIFPGFVFLAICALLVIALFPLFWLHFDYRKYRRLKEQENGKVVCVIKSPGAEENGSFEEEPKIHLSASMKNGRCRGENGQRKRSVTLIAGELSEYL